MCGSKEHPAIDAYKRLDISENRARKARREKELAELTKDLQRAGRDMAGIEARLATCDHQRQELEKMFLTYQDAWEKICRKLNIAMDIHHVEEIKSWLNGEETRTLEIKEILSRLEKIRGRIQKLETSLQQARDKEKETGHLMEMGKNQKEVLAQRASEIQAVQRETQQEIQVVEEKLRQMMKSLDKQLPDPDKQALWLDRHKGFWEAWKTAQTQREEAQKTLDLIKGEISLLEKEKSLVKVQLSELAEQLTTRQTLLSNLVSQRKQVFGEKSIKKEPR